MRNESNMSCVVVVVGQVNQKKVMLLNQGRVCC